MSFSSLSTLFLKHFSFIYLDLYINIPLFCIYAYKKAYLLIFYYFFIIYYFITILLIAIACLSMFILYLGNILKCIFQHILIYYSNSCNCLSKLIYDITPIHNWPLQSFSQDYVLASLTTHVACVNFMLEWRDMFYFAYNMLPHSIHLLNALLLELINVACNILQYRIQLYT